MNRNIGILFGVVAPTDGAFADDIRVETLPFASTVTRAEVVAELTMVREANPMHRFITEHSSISFELRFLSLFPESRVLAFPCDPQGRVDLNAVSDRTKNDYLFARAMVGREYATPIVQQLREPTASISPALAS